MKNIFMVMYEVKLENGGVTKVMLNRSHFFDELGFKSCIVTLDPNQDYQTVQKQLRDCNRLHPNSKIVNFYDFYKNKNTIVFNNNSTDYEHQMEESNLLIQSQFFLTKRFLRYFSSNGILVKTKHWKNGELSYVEYYEKNIISFIKYYKNNQHYRTIFLDENSNEIEEKYFTNDGFCYFQKILLGLEKKIHLFIYDRHNNSVVGFNSYKKAHAFFLEELCENKNKNKNIIICDGIGSIEKICAVSNKKAILIGTIHTNHLSSPYTLNSKIKKNHEILFYNLEKLDYIITLSNSQRNDLVQQFGYEDKFYVIPNTVKGITDFKKENIKDKLKKISIISRYVSMKNLDHIILAIKIILNKIERNQIEVNFYGVGEEKLNLISLVKKLKMEDIIHINDYVTDVEKVYRSAHISINTSDYEGFPLTFVESMSNKTPIISYKVNYGPRDIIDHNENGYLVEYGNIEMLSETILNVLFKNFSKYENISDNALKTVNQNFSHEKAKNLWLNLLSN